MAFTSIFPVDATVNVSHAMFTRALGTHCPREFVVVAVFCACVTVPTIVTVVAESSVFQPSKVRVLLALTVSDASAGVALVSVALPLITTSCPATGTPPSQLPGVFQSPEAAVNVFAALAAPRMQKQAEHAAMRYRC